MFKKQVLLLLALGDVDDIHNLNNNLYGTFKSTIVITARFYQSCYRLYFLFIPLQDTY